MRTIILQISIALCFAAAGCGGSDDSGGGDEGRTLAIGEIVARDADGNALRLDETVTTEGIAIADAGLFANNKVRQFIQDGGDGVMVFHATSGEVPSFSEGDRLRISGRVGQRDPSTEDNRVEGTVLIDTTSGSVEVLGGGNPVPAPVEVTLAELVATGDQYVATLVRIRGARRTSGDWPEPGARSSELTITDDDGASQLILRLQRNTIDDEMIEATADLGDAPFDLVAIVVQDDTDDDGDLLDGYELWPRGGKDVTPE